MAANALTAKCIYNIKKGCTMHGTVERAHEAELTARGFRQTVGFEFEQILAPVIPFPSSELFLSLVAQDDLYLCRINFKTGFLYEARTRDNHGTARRIQRKNLSKFVCKPNKVLYGLKQAPAH